VEGGIEKERRGKGLKPAELTGHKREFREEGRKMTLYKK